MTSSSPKYLIDSLPCSIEDAWNFSFQLLNFLKTSQKKNLDNINFHPGNIEISGDIGVNNHGKRLKYFEDLPVYYLAPEESGRIAQNPDYRSNYYRLGIILYELFCERPPFYDKDYLKVIWSHIASPIPPMGLDKNMSLATKVIEKLLQKTKEKRYQSINGIIFDWTAAYESYKNNDDQSSHILGSRDLPSSFQLAETFIGRLDEIATVNHLIQSVHANDSKGLAIIVGEESVGKTRFVNHIIENIRVQDFIVLHSDGNIDTIAPYHLFVTAFNKHLRWLQISDEQVLFNIKTKLIDALEENVGVFTAFAPMWEKILGKHAIPVALGQRETLFRLSYVLSKVIAVFSLNNYPLFFAIDNLQNASEQSINLLISLLSESDIKKCTFCIALNKKSSSVEALDLYEKLQSSSTTLISKIMTLEGLNDSDIEQLLILSKINPQQVPSLKNYLINSTAGLPLLIKELLSQANTLNFITPNYKNQCWDIDTDKIKTIKLSTSISAHNKSRISTLNDQEIEFLKIAACIGISFDIEIVKFIQKNNPSEDLEVTIFSIQDKDLIISTEIAGNYLFINDEIYKSILSQVDKDHYDKILIGIVDFYKAKRFPLVQDSDLFTYLKYLILLPNRLIVDDKNLLLETAQKAKNLGALNEAANIYAKLLDAQLYDSPQEKFELQNSLMAVWLGALNFKPYYELRSKLITQLELDTLKTARLDALHCRALTNEQKFDEAVNHAIESLKKLNVNIVQKPSLLRVIYNMVTASRAIQKKSMLELKSLPELTDQKTKIILDILHETSSSFFLTSPQTLPEVISLQVKFALEKGIHERAAIAFSTYGFSVSSFRKDFKTSEEMMALAYQICDRFDDTSSKAVSRFLHYGLSRHWIAPHRENIKLLNKNYNFSLNVGQIGIGFYSLGIAAILRVFSGESLNELKPLLLTNIKACQDKSQSMVVEFLNIILQFIENINDPNDAIILLEGEYYSLSKNSKILVEQNQQTTLTVLHSMKGLYKMLLNISEGSLDRLQIISNQIKKLGLSSVSLLYGYIFNLLSLVDNKNIPTQLIKKKILQVKEWATLAPFNFEGWYDLCQAAYFKRLADPNKFFFHIESAILWFENQKVLYALAYAKQMKVAYIAKYMNTTPSQQEINNIADLYHAWGASLLANKIKSEYELQNTFNITKRKPTHQIDLKSLLKSSTTIAGEIKFDNLLEKLSEILIENAGAQKVVIFQMQSGEWFEIARKLGKEPISIHNVKVGKNIHPISLLRSVRNTMTHEIIGDLNDFEADIYLQSTRPLSAMALPVVKNRDIIAIIYLENHLLKGAFTEDRIELLKLLSGQVAISLENASLYHDLERRVEERTNELTQKNTQIQQNNQKLTETVKQLKETQIQLIQSEKMASLGELTAGIAHEIQNPLNFVNNFSEVSAELIEEMEEEIENGNFQEVKSLSAFIKSNLEKINHHGKRADAIVKGMLQHSRSSTGQKENTDINALCNEYLKLAYHGLRAKDKSFNSTINTDFSSEIPEINIVKQDIGRVILNIITNAFHAVSERALKEAKSYSPVVSLSTRIHNNKVEISISDNGVGIPENIKQKIFQPFFTTKPTGQGTGLGLSMSYDIIKAHGGSIKIESKINEGTTFFITL